MASDLASSVVRPWWVFGSSLLCGRRYEFDSNAITPGTVFMIELAARLQQLLEGAVAAGSPGFQGIKVGTGLLILQVCFLSNLLLSLCL